MQFPVKYQHATLKITGLDHIHAYQIEGKASKNHTVTIQTDRPLSESCCPRVNRKNSCFPFSAAGSMEYFLSPSFLASFSVKVTILRGRGNVRVTNPKELEAFGRAACMRLSCWVAGKRQVTDDAGLARAQLLWIP